MWQAPAIRSSAVSDGRGLHMEVLPYQAVAGVRPSRGAPSPWVHEAEYDRCPIITGCAARGQPSTGLDAANLPEWVTSQAGGERKFLVIQLTHTRPSRLVALESRFSPCAELGHEEWRSDCRQVDERNRVSSSGFRGVSRPYATGRPTRPCDHGATIGAARYLVGWLSPER